MKKKNRKIYDDLEEGKNFLLTDYTDNYELYVENQKILNERKFGGGCNDGYDIFQKIRDKVLEINKNPTFGLCHGVRSGQENKWLGELLNCKVIGTEIGDKFGFPEITIQWDMHDIKEEWIDSCDVIYSNSFDHTYDPIHCLSQWSKTLNPKTGIIVLQYASNSHHIPRHIESKTYSPGDPFNAPEELLIDMVNNHTPLEMVSIETWRGNGVNHIIFKRGEE